MKVTDLARVLTGELAELQVRLADVVAVSSKNPIVERQAHLALAQALDALTSVRVAIHSVRLP